jgi:hypothetical protein
MPVRRSWRVVGVSKAIEGISADESTSESAAETTHVKNNSAVRIKTKITGIFSDTD